MKSRESLWSVLLLAFAFTLVIVWYTPAVLYSSGSNQQQFYFPLVQVLPMLAIPLLVGTAVLVIPGLLMRGSARQFYMMLLACLTAYVWIQGFLLVRDYGLLDGQIELPRFSLTPLILSGATILLVSAIGTWVRPFRLVWGAVVVIVLLLVHVVVMVIADPKPVRALERPRFESLYELGSENLLVVLLDSLQADVFEDVIEERPDLAAGLKGFTFYPNTMGVGPSTYGSLPAIHAGRMRQPGQSMADHFRNSISRDSFEVEMAGNGWKVTHLNPVAGICPLRIDGCFDYNRDREENWTTRLAQQSASMFDLSLFRLAPPEVKSEVYNSNRWLVSPSVKSVSIQESSDTALREFTEKIRQGDEEKVAKFIHLQSTHAPAVRAADCTLLKEPVSPITRQLAHDAATCALTRVGSLTQKLEEMGLYDATSIVLLADHGYLGMGTEEVDDERWTKLIGSANPLFAVKPPSGHGPMVTSKAPLSLVDVPTIVCSLTNGCAARSENWASPAVDRPRSYMHYDWGDAFWFASTLRNERHYEVRGPLTDPSSWRDLGGAPVPVVSKLTFGVGDHASHYGYGWDPVDEKRGDGSRWGVQKHATLNLRLADDRTSKLVFDVGTLPELVGQTLSVKVNLEPVGTVEVKEESETVTFTVPAGVGGEDIDELHLIFSRYREGNPDINRHVRRSQQLAIRFDELRISYE